LFFLGFAMVPEAEFWQTWHCMQNASEAGSETSISVPSPDKPSLSSQLPAPGAVPASLPEPRPREIGGPEGPEPTRYGDWEKKGRCIDF
jgi:hypothetical protein